MELNEAMLKETLTDPDHRSAHIAVSVLSFRSLVDEAYPDVALAGDVAAATMALLTTQFPDLPSSAYRAIGQMFYDQYLEQKQEEVNARSKM